MIVIGFRFQARPGWASETVAPGRAPLIETPISLVLSLSLPLQHSINLSRVDDRTHLQVQRIQSHPTHSMDHNKLSLDGAASDATASPSYGNGKGPAHDMMGNTDGPSRRPNLPASAVE